MFSTATILATVKALQIYGLSIVISMGVAVLIKVLVVVTSRAKQEAKDAAPVQKASPSVPTKAGIPDEVVTAITAVIAVVTGPHRILHIAETSNTWSRAGRNAQHSHQPRH